MLGILLNKDNELEISVVRNAEGKIESSIIVGNIDYQRCKLIMECQKGEIKEFPIIGFGIDQYLKAGKTLSNRQKFMTDLIKELKMDEMNVKINLDKNKGIFEIEIL